MAQAVALRQDNAVAHFNPDQVDLIKRTICKGATDDELRLFMYQAEKTGLDPLARQIYSIERRENRGGQWVTVRSIQTSIDGFRLVAQRSGQYEGQTEPQWCGDDGVWKDVWLAKEPPAAARVGVWRAGFKEPCYGVARFDAYAQKKEGKPTAMWAKMPDVMIAKCAEALALRKAFPQELSGLYTSDEMDQAQPVDVTPPRASTTAAAPLPPPVPTEPPHHPETGEVSPHQIPIGYVPGDDGMDRSDWLGWGKSMIAAVKSATLLAELQAWQDLNQAALASCAENAPKAYKSVDGAIQKRRKELAPPKEPELIEEGDAANVLLAG